MNTRLAGQRAAADPGREARRTRRRLRAEHQARRTIESFDDAERAAPDLPLPVAVPTFESPSGPDPAEVFRTPETLLDALRQCVTQAEGLLAEGNRAATLGCLAEASDLFAALDDFEAAALAGGAADAGRLDEVLDQLLAAVDDHRR